MVSEEVQIPSFTSTILNMPEKAKGNHIHRTKGNHENNISLNRDYQ